MRCLQGGNFTKARDLLEQVCRIDNKDADVWFLLGAIYGQAGKISRAIQCSEKALGINPVHVDAAYNLGQAYRRASKYREAERCFLTVLEFRPGVAEVYDMLGYVLQEQGKYKEAKASYRKALEINPNLSGTAYLLAALEGGDSVPGKAPEDYVRGLFDGFADHFEETLVGELGYSTPRHVREALERVLDTVRALNILDIGCGTGLSGEEVKHLAGRLVGVDLSSKMVEVARRKGIYDSLHVADIVNFMRSDAGQYNAVLSVDVFVYIGDLSTVFELCKSLLVGSGVFAFSVEATEDSADYILKSTNRYAHSRSYIDKLAEQYQMKCLSCDEVVLRKQKSEPVKGYIYVLQRN